MLSVIIIAKDEEATIGRCLESVQWATEIIVLDSGSMDQTIEIARQFTEQVYSTDWQGYGVQKQRALSYATGEWVLNLDADEVVDEHLKKSIEQAIQDNHADAYRIPIQMYFYNKSLRYSSSPKRHIRLFRRKDAHYSDDIVHEKIILPPNSCVKQMKHPIRHDSFRDLSHALNKMNRYSSYSAKIRLAGNKHTTLIKIMGGTAWMFLRCFVLQRGFLDGKAGFILALLNAQGTFFRGLKQLYPDSQLENLPSIKGRPA